MAPNDQTTQNLARIVGPFLALVGAAVALRAQMLTGLLDSLTRDPALVFILALLTLMIGLVVLVLHHRWRTPAQVVLSTLAVLFILRGVALLLAPDWVLALAHRLEPLTPYAGVGGGVAILVGGYLAWEGYGRRAAR